MQAKRRLTFGCWADCIGHIEDALPRSEIALELDRRSFGIATDEPAQAARIRPPEAVNGLGLVTDHREALAVRGQQPHDFHLEAVQILVLVDQHVAKALGQLWPELVVPHQGTPIEEEIIEIEEGRAAFAGGKIPEQLADDLEVGFTPRVLERHQIAQRALRIDASGVDVDEGGGTREPGGGPRQGVIASEQIHQIAGPCRIEDAECRRQVEHLRVAGHVSMGDGVEGAALGPFAPAETHQIASPANISSAARRVNVRSRIRSGATPRSRRHATREVSARVLPVPAPATTTSGVSPWVATAVGHRRAPRPTPTGKRTSVRILLIPPRAPSESKTPADRRWSPFQTLFAHRRRPTCTPTSNRQTEPSMLHESATRRYQRLNRSRELLVARTDSWASELVTKHSKSARGAHPVAVCVIGHAIGTSIVRVLINSAPSTL